MFQTPFIMELYAKEIPVFFPFNPEHPRIKKTFSFPIDGSCEPKKGPRDRKRASPACKTAFFKSSDFFFGLFVTKLQIFLSIPQKKILQIPQEFQLSAVRSQTLPLPAEQSHTIPVTYGFFRTD